MDFAPISPLTAVSDFRYATKTVPARDLPELIAWLTSNPRVSAATAAVGPRLVTAVFQRETGTRLAVAPYRCKATVFQDLMGGQIRHLFQFTGRVAAGAGRQPQSLCRDKQHTSERTAPDIPTFAELGLAARTLRRTFRFSRTLAFRGSRPSSNSTSSRTLVSTRSTSSSVTWETLLIRIRRCTGRSAGVGRSSALTGRAVQTTIRWCQS
jgi:hypothetical protein